MKEVTIVTVMYDGHIITGETQAFTNISDAEEYMIQKIKDYCDGDFDLDGHDEDVILEDGYFEYGSFYISINEIKLN